MVAALAVTAIILTSLLATLGAFLLAFNPEKREAVLPYLIALSTGAIFGGVFIHLIFKYINKYGFTRLTGLTIASTIGGMLFLEKIIHWHCHHSESDKEPFSYMVLFGDAIHNIFDGIIIASGFVISTQAGIVATIGIILHKIPKEIGDFATLVTGGFSEREALLFNFGVGVFMLLGGGVVLLFQGSAVVESVLLPVAIGSLIYIGGTDLFPEIKEHHLNNFYLAVSFFTGVAVMYAIVLIKPALG
ncbi:ZIP family metal transporter [Candidatus Nanohalococcus occultus]|uniref:Divalent heavy-metal cations transporter n=1 Tax=Candidatus Nanohalococcus occultus TaxID=2978047 RepID=A0ABY8CFR0_9ARCH|nr:Putative divalent heavy-metal cations transporter [Candidatus Nanohaloarchaeota archaeon SVXNc]